MWWKGNLFVFVVVLYFVGLNLEVAKALMANLEEPWNKQEEDAIIQKTLFGETPKIQECLNVTLRRQTPDSKRNNTRPDKALWTVVILKEEILQNKTLNMQQCAGSLIHPQVVLTAAHCLYNKSISELKIRAGESNRKPDKNATFHQERRIENVVFQKLYDPSKLKKDIALVFLKNPFNITNHVKTVCLPPKRFPANITYVRCFVTGWETKTHVKLGHANFRKIDLPIIPKDKCEKVLRMTMIGEDFNLHKSYMCAGGELDKSALDGNGGAPLVCPVCGTNGKLVQVGIMSWGFNIAPLPEVFTDVYKARHWIVKELQDRKMKLPSCGINWSQDNVDP